MSVKASYTVTIFDVSDGTGVVSITDEYYLSTSKTGQTGGSWVTDPPTWSSGKYLWTRSKIVYENPDSTVYTTPVCDSSWEAVNEITVGGRNYIRNGNFEDEIVGNTNILRRTNTSAGLSSSGGSWSKYAWGSASDGTGTRMKIPVSDAPFSVIEYGWRFGASDTGSTDIMQGDVPVTNGQEYTLSCYAKGTGTLRMQYGKDPYLCGENAIDSDSWNIYSYTFTIGAESDGSTDGYTDIYFGIAAGGDNTTNSIEICGMKLEVGAEVTNWSPNSGDGTLPSGEWRNWGSPTTREVVTEDDKNWVHVVTSTSDTRWQGLRQKLISSESGISFVENEEITLSARFKTEQEDAQQICVGVRFMDADSGKLSEIWSTGETVKSEDGVYKLTKTVTTPANTESVLVYVGSDYATTDAYDFYFTDVKLEKGCKATDWTPAIEDMATSSDLKSEIEVAQNNSNYKINELDSRVEEYKATQDDDLDTLKKETDNKIAAATKYFNFDDENGLTISTSDDSEVQLALNNDKISFKKNGTTVSYWDGTDDLFHVGNLYVALYEKAQFGNFAFVPRSDGSLSFLKVGE